MKKHLFWLVLGAAALSACATTDVIEEGVQSNAIGFENVISKPQKSSTRSEVTGDLTLNDFDLFSVYGYYTKNGMEGHAVQVFSGDEVTKHETIKEDGEKVISWTYADTRYWMPDATYYFYAYSCADIAITSNDKGSIGFIVSADAADAETRIDKRSLKIEKYVCNDTHQHDLICAFAEGITGQASGNTPVKFTFRHALCKVSAEFVNDFPAGYDITISDVKITNFYDVANLNVRSITGNVASASTAWYGQERTAVNKELAMTITGGSVATSTNNKDVEATKVTTGSVFLLPVAYDNANVNIQFNLTVSQGSDTFMNRTIQGTWKPEWIPGRAYKYTIHITGTTAKLKPIVFEANQDITGAESWDKDITTDMTFGTI